MSDGAKISFALAGVAVDVEVGAARQRDLLLENAWPTLYQCVLGFAFAVVGGIGYYLWNQSQTAAANTTAGGGTISSGNQPYQLGTSTSTGMPAASTTSDGLPISYEAGAGTNAPLVATG